MTIIDTLNMYKELLKQKGYKVIYIGLYGSQNYNVNDDKSDIDAKAVVLPTLSDIIHRKPVSTVIETEFGGIDVKDLITFADVIRKGNFSYIEAIQTSYFVGDDAAMQRLFGDIPVNLKSMIGGMLEKRKALTHEYPGKTEEFEQFGCDPKQYHHIVRLYDLLFNDITYKQNWAYIAYFENGADFMIKLKRGEAGLSVAEMEASADKYIADARELLNSAYPDYKYQPIDNQQIVDDYIEQELRKMLAKGEK